MAERRAETETDTAKQRDKPEKSTVSKKRAPKQSMPQRDVREVAAFDSASFAQEDVLVKTEPLLSRQTILRNYLRRRKREFATGESHVFVRKTPVAAKLSHSWISANLPLQQINKIQEIATSVFGDATAAMEWLQDPNLATYNKPPISLLGSDEGFEHVKTLLMRIEYGNLA